MKYLIPFLTSGWGIKIVYLLLIVLVFTGCENCSQFE